MIGQWPLEKLHQHLATEGLVLDLGAAAVRLHSSSKEIAHAVQMLYHAFEAGDAETFCVATAHMKCTRHWHHAWRQQVEFISDGELLFEPFPGDTHLPLIEWGLNYLMADRLNSFLLLHAGAVEYGGRAIVLPAMPGSGKSTLSAALSLRGFRLLSDEFGVVQLNDSKLVPLLRPVSLKNASIDVIRNFSKQAVIGPSFPKTRKGTVAHLAPQRDAVVRRFEPAIPALVVFPKFDPKVALEIEPIMTSRAFSKLAVNSFNYEILGRAGFDAVARLLASSACYRLVYNDLEQAVHQLTALLNHA